MPDAKRGKKSKRVDARLSRKTYWTNRMLEKRKVANMLKNRQPMIKGGRPMSQKECVAYWESHRKGRVPDNFFRKTG